jgi:preprotein translocase subunit SecY
MAEPDAPWQPPSSDDEGETRASPELVEEKRIIPRGKGPIGRLAITLIAPLALMLGRSIPIPGLDLSNSVFSLHGQESARVSLLAVGISPIVQGFVFAEILALIVPSWRRIRLGGSADRARLRRVALLLGFVLALVQIGTIARTVDQPLITFTPKEADVAAELIAGASLFATTIALYAITRLIDARGLGNGFAALLGSGAVIDSTVRLYRDGTTALSTVEGASADLLFGAGLLGIMVWLTREFLLGRAPWKRMAYGGVVVPEPPSGIHPFSWAERILVVPWTLRAVGIETPFERFAPGNPAYEIGYWVLVALLVGIFAALFNRPALVAARSGAHPADAQRALVRSAVQTIVFFEALIIGTHLIALQVAQGILASVSFTSLFLIVAWAIDLVREWNARAASPDLIAIRPEQRPYAVRPLVLLLESRDVFVFARSQFMRTVLQFFGPHVPIEIMVPRSRCEEAEAILDADQRNFTSA